MSRVRVGATMAVGVVAVSFAAIIIRYADAPSLAISFWRVTASLVLAIGVVTTIGAKEGLRDLSSGDHLRVAGAGVCLGIHFWAWISSLQYTTVTASVLLVTTNPIWVGLLSPLLGRALSGREWAGIAVATSAGLLVALGGGDGEAPDPLLGNLLALIGGISASGYLLFGKSVREKLGLWPYAASTLAVAWVVLGIGMLATDTPFAGYPSSAWLWFLLLALGPQLIGHNAMSWSLRWVGAEVVALALLLEPIGSALLAWPLLDETPTTTTVLAGLVMLAGLALTLTTSSRRDRA